MATLLGQLIDGREGSQLIVLEDSVAHSGRALLRCITTELAYRLDQVHIFNFDTPPDVFINTIDTKIKGKLQCHDGWTNPLQWNLNSSNGRHNSLDISSSEDVFMTNVQKCNRDDSKRVCVVVDSLSPVLLRKSITYVCNGLDQLIRSNDLGFEVCLVVCLLHKDVHDENALRAINHLASTVLTLSSYMSLAPLSEAPLGICSIVHKRKTGKVFKKKEGYSVDGDYRLITFPEEQRLTTIPMETPKQGDPTANLTFNLTLRDSERQARSEVVLPYTLSAKRKADELNPGGKIYYEPDDADDFDDEDPDDDLDI
ncbi:elongator complex protein 5-like [Anneissia japonica]|uniref:elongator complex protein 5-like n=1 Tax=Anneissia japonica TaxID=1529436 RepID=UPI0014258223|nr:elongator complex protein 5-like [Anneissia japonica]